MTEIVVTFLEVPLTYTDSEVRSQIMTAPIHLSKLDPKCTGWSAFVPQSYVPGSDTDVKQHKYVTEEEADEENNSFFWNGKEIQLSLCHCIPTCI